MTHRIALSGLLIAMMLVLGFIERFIPTPVPGMKLGLSNSILIFAVYMLDLPTAWLLMLLKVLLNGLMFGTIASSSLYALAGGVLSLLTMTLLSRMKGVHPITVSMLGGVMHNVGQVLVAMFLFHTNQLLFYMAILMITGLGFGAATGTCATLVMKHLKNTKYFRNYKVKS